MPVDDRAPDRVAHVRRGHVQRDVAVVSLEPHDVARPSGVDAAGDRRPRADDLFRRAAELEHVVIVAVEVRQALRRCLGAGERVVKSLGRELDREPGIVARAHARRHSHALLRWREERAKSREELGAPLVSHRDLGPEPLRCLDPGQLA